LTVIELSYSAFNAQIVADRRGIDRGVARNAGEVDIGGRRRIQVVDCSLLITGAEVQQAAELDAGVVGHCRVVHSQLALERAIVIGGAGDI